MKPLAAQFVILDTSGPLVLTDLSGGCQCHFVLIICIQVEDADVAQGKELIQRFPHS